MPNVRTSMFNVAWLLGGGGLSSIVALAEGIVLARFIGPAGVGKWGIVIAFCSVLSGFLTFRTPEPFLKGLVKCRVGSNNHDEICDLFGAAISVELLSAALCTALVILASITGVVGVFSEETPFSIFLIYAPTFLFSCLEAVWTCVARDRGQFKLLSVVPFSFCLVRLIAIASLWAFSPPSLLYLALIYLAVSFLKFLFALNYLTASFKTYNITWNELEVRPTIRRSPHLHEFWDFMKVGYLASVLSTMMKNVDLLILGFFLPNESVGLYRIGKSLATVVQMVVSSGSTVFYRDFNEHVQRKDREALNHLMMTLLLRWAPVIGAAGVVSIFVAPYVVTTLYGAQFQESIPVLQILLVGVHSSVALFWTQPLLYSRGAFRANFIVLLISAILFILIGPLCTSLFGIKGMATIQSLMWIGTHLSFLYLVFRLRATPL